MPGDRNYAEQAALRDPRLAKLAAEWNDFMGIKEEPRSYARIGTTDSELL